ncbi:hypothetical protein ACA910_009945 [Epithemia clementina (nom. ined.)]
MNRFLTMLLVLAAVYGSNGFTVVPAVTSTAKITHGRTTSTAEANIPFATSSTALEMVKVKIDPNKKQDKINKGDLKMAAYGGSIAIGVLLPLIFVIWAAVSK